MMNFDFKSGQIIYNEFHIDFTKPFYAQKASLTEDLLQVEYENGVIIDLGWYPEYDENGFFLVKVIQEHDWGTPIYDERSRGLEQLTECINCAVDIALRTMKKS